LVSTRSKAGRSNVQTFFTYFDEPSAGELWLADNVKLSPTEQTKHITAYAYGEWFETLGTGRLALPMFAQALPAQARAYSPDLELTIPLLIECGDPISRIVYSMRS
jgi:hypothetical protein